MPDPSDLVHRRDLNNGQGLICRLCDNLIRGVPRDGLCRPTCSCHPRCWEAWQEEHGRV